MAGLHPIEDEEVLKQEIESRDIRYTRHFEEKRLPRRENVTKDLIKKHLRDPVDLLEFVFEDDDHRREKYQLLFDKSSKYYLKTVLSMEDDSLYIVTAHVVNKTKKEKSQVVD
jgi:hypothetical protein